MLDVKQQRVEDTAGGVQDFPRREAAGFRRSADVPAFGLAQQGQGALRLKKRFAAGNGHAPFRAGIELAVLLHDPQNGIDRADVAIGNKRLGGTGLGAGLVAVAAVGAMDGEGFSRRPGDGTVRTGFDAARAGFAEAATGVEGDLPESFLGFRVAAPTATQRASLEEDHRADARAVVDGIFLDIEDGACAVFVVRGVHKVSDLPRSGAGDCGVGRLGGILSSGGILPPEDRHARPVSWSPSLRGLPRRVLPWPLPGSRPGFAARICRSTRRK